jgi:hypothetical protein
MNKTPIQVYVIGVIIVMAVILCLARFVGGGIHFKKILIFFSGFLIGMLAMYIAVHLYKWK